MGCSKDVEQGRRIWVSICDSPGTHFGHLFVIFLWFWVPKLEIVSRSMFLVIQGWKWCQNAVSVCAINIVKTSVLERFHFFYFFTNLVSRGMVLGAFWVSFGDLGGTFSDFWGSWRQAWNLMIFQGYQGTPQVESTTPGGGNTLLPGLQ